MGVERPRVLYVAGDASAVERHAGILEGRGFDVVTASDAESAFHHLEQYSFDCVLSNYRLPGRDGIEFLREVRKDDPGMPFVLLTSETSTAVVERAVSAGVTDYVPTLLLNISEELLAHRVRRAVRADDVERDEAPPIARQASDGYDSGDASSNDLFDIVAAALGNPVKDESRTQHGDFVWVPLWDSTAGAKSSGYRTGREARRRARQPDPEKPNRGEAKPETPGPASVSRRRGTRARNTAVNPDTDGGTDVRPSEHAGGEEDQFVFPGERAVPSEEALRTDDHDGGLESGPGDGDSGRDVTADRGAEELFDLVEKIGTGSEDGEGDTTDGRGTGLRDEENSMRVKDGASAGSEEKLPADDGDANAAGLADLSEEELFDRAESLQERLIALREGDGTDKTSRTDETETTGRLDGAANGDDAGTDGDDAHESADSTEDYSTPEDLLELDPDPELGPDTGTAPNPELDAETDMTDPGEISGTDHGESTAESIIDEPPADVSTAESTVADGTVDSQTGLSPGPGSQSVEEYEKPGNLDLRPGTSVMLQCGSQDDRQDAACVDLLQPDRVADNNVLLIRYRQMSESRLETIASNAARTKIISIGYTQPVPRSVRDSVENIKINNPNDVTRLGIVVTGTIDKWRNVTGDTVVCYEPLDVLLRYKSVHSVFRFLHIFLSKLQAGGAIAHFHVDPSAGDPQEINTLKPLFDAVLTIDSVGTHLES